MPEPTQRYRYDVRYFKIPDGGFHSCTGNVVAVLSSSYNVSRKTTYLSLLIQTPEDGPPPPMDDAQPDDDGGW